MAPGAPQVRGGGQPVDLLHNEFLAALQIGDIGSQLVGLPQGQRAFIDYPDFVSDPSSGDTWSDAFDDIQPRERTG